MLNIIEHDADKIRNQENYFRDKIDEVVFPHIDFQSMTRRIVGKNWQKASELEQKELTSEFRQFLLNTYTVALSELNGGEVFFKPFKPSRKESNAIVKSTFSPGGSLAFPVDYWLQKTDDWKIVNLVVAERSLISSYRESFTDIIRSDGIAGLIETLKTKNN